RVEVFGVDPATGDGAFRRRIGIVPQEIIFDPFFTPFEALEVQAGLYGVAKSKRRTMELLRAVHLEDKADAYARTLSGGMKRRLLVAKAMVHSPPILVLDEPTAGVDIDLRQQLWEYVLDLNKAGVTIVLTTHYLEEAENLCDRIAIINHGKLIANQPTPELVDMAREKLVELTLDRDISEAQDAVSFANDLFEKAEIIGPRTVAVTYNKDRTNAGGVMAAIQERGFAIVDVTTREADLEDVFLNLTRAKAA
ncbi:MAG: ABC transporter ATP-binding protein, partial [Sphingomonadales bacterium]|nr:ABC transporter ATP-binding protein [Sphingomonadales bacterium]